MKKIRIIVIIALLGIILIGGYTVFDNIFPKSDPVNYPDTESIKSVTLIYNSDSSFALERAEFKELLNNISNAQPTRKTSVNDYPAVKNYYIIDIDAETRQYRYFLYSENSKVYIELPYEGIYKSDQQLLDYVAKHFQD